MFSEIGKVRPAVEACCEDFDSSHALKGLSVVRERVKLFIVEYREGGASYYYLL